MTTAGPCGPGCTPCTARLPTSGPRVRASADGAAALAPASGRVNTATRVKPRRASRPRAGFLTAPWTGPGVQGSLGSPCHWLPAAAPSPFHPSRHAHRRKAEPSELPSRGRTSAQRLPALRRLWRPQPQWKIFRRRTEAARRGPRPFPPGSFPREKPLPARALCRKPRPPRGSATLAPPPSSALTARAPHAGFSA